MSDEQQRMREFHDAMAALDRAQAAEQPLREAIGNTDPAAVPPSLCEQWYRLNEVTVAARNRVHAAVRALSGQA